MDCMDCHSRPAHKVHTPNDAVDLALSTGRLDPNTPWVKSKVVAALVQPYKTKSEAEQGIANSLREAYPDPAQADRIINEAQAIYRENFFPEVKARLADTSRFCRSQELEWLLSLSRRQTRRRRRQKVDQGERLQIMPSDPRPGQR